MNSAKKTTAAPATRKVACLVAGGKYHDIDFARAELLKLLYEHEGMRVRVMADYESVEQITTADFLISYTCDVRPSEKAQNAIAEWVRNGGRWYALHGTNSALTLGGRNGVESPRAFPVWAHTLGSQFIAHPPIQPFKVKVANPKHWLVKGIKGFTADDELYLSEYHDMDNIAPLLSTKWSGEARGFEESDWTLDTQSTDEHLVMYLRTLEQGAVLYNTLGHCRGHYDMAPHVSYYPKIERGSWDVDEYYELLRRGIRWALGQSS